MSDDYVCALFRSGSSVPEDPRVRAADSARDAALEDAYERDLSDGEDWEVRASKGHRAELLRVPDATVTAVDLNAETRRAGAPVRRPSRKPMPWRTSAPGSAVLDGSTASRLDVGSTVLVTADRSRTNALECRGGLYPARDAQDARVARVTGKSELERGGKITSVTLHTNLGEVGPLRSDQAVLLAPEEWKEAA